MGRRADARRTALRVDAVAGADHHRLAAGPRPRRQGADRRRQHASRSSRRPTSARCRPSRPTSPSSSAIACDDEGPLPEAPGASAAAARASLYVLPNFQNPSGRCDRRRARGGDRRRAQSARPADRRGQPLRRPLVRRRAAAAARPRAGATARSTSARFSKVLAPGLRLGYAIAPAAVMPEAAAGQAGRRPAHAGLQPARGARGDPATASCASTCRRSARRYKAQRDAMRGALDANLPQSGRALPLEGAGRRHVLLARAARRASTPRQLLPRAVERGVALRAGRAVLCRRGDEEHPAPVVRDRRARGDRARRARASPQRWRRCREHRLRLHPGRRLHRAAAARQPARRRARRRRARRGADAGVRAVDQPAARRPSCSRPPTRRPTTASASSRPAASCRLPAIPTLGSCHAWLERGGVPKTAGRVVQQCGVGGWSTFAPRPGAPPSRRRRCAWRRSRRRCSPRCCRPSDWSASAVRCFAMARQRPRWLGLLLRDAAAVLALAPDFAALRSLAKVGVVGAYPSGLGVRVRAAGVRVDGRRRRGSGHRQPQRRRRRMADRLGPRAGALRGGAGCEARSGRAGPRVARGRAVLDRRQQRQLHPRRGRPVRRGARGSRSSPTMSSSPRAASAEGAAWCEATLGATPVEGGRHATMGTHNRLLGLGGGAYGRMYLEIIALDPDASPPNRARWYDLDSPALRAEIAVGAAAGALGGALQRHRSGAIAALRAAGHDPGDAIAVERMTAPRPAALAHLAARRRPAPGRRRGAAPDRMGPRASLRPPAGERRLGRAHHSRRRRPQRGREARRVDGGRGIAAAIGLARHAARARRAGRCLGPAQAPGARRHSLR